MGIHEIFIGYRGFAGTLPLSPQAKSASIGRVVFNLEPRAMHHRIVNLGTVAVAIFGLALSACKPHAAERDGAPTQVRQPDGAQRPEDAIKAAVGQLEKAVQTGDGALWLSLQSTKRLSEMNDTQQAEFKKSVRAAPDYHYVPQTVRASANHGIASCRVGRSDNSMQYEVIKFVQEDRAWKIEEEGMSDSLPDPRGLSALLPPADGAFLRAGSPWPRVPYAAANVKFFKDAEFDWKLQATADESFLYLRFEARAPLPAPGKEIFADHSAPGGPVRDGGPPPPPIMKIKLAGKTGGQEFTVQASDTVQTRSTFDPNGKANSNRFFVDYTLTLWSGKDAVVLTNDTNDTFSPLVAVHDRFLDLKIPLTGLGLATGDSPAIAIEEANSFAKILPYQVGRSSPSP